MRIAITGASGHVGCNLVRNLLASGKHKIKVLQYRDHAGLDGLDLEVVLGNIHQPENLEILCKDVDVVFHLAAKISIGSTSYKSIYETNVEGTKNLVIAAKNAGVKKLIHFSSIHAFDPHPMDEALDESRPLMLHSKIAYEKTKSIATKWVLSQVTEDFEVVILHPTSVIGPYDYKPSLMGQMFINLYNHSLPGLVPGGYDWVDVRDIVKSAVAAIEKGKSGEQYILSGGWTSVKYLAKIFAEVSERKPTNFIFPLWLAKLGVPFISVWSKLAKQDPIYTYESLEILQLGNSNITYQKAARDLGHTSRPLEETLSDTIEWFKENKYF